MDSKKNEKTVFLKNENGSKNAFVLFHVLERVSRPPQAHLTFFLMHGRSHSQITGAIVGALQHSSSSPCDHELACHKSGALCKDDKLICILALLTGGTTTLPSFLEIDADE